MTREGRTDLRKLLGLVPALVMRDPLFRYAAIAAILALLFLIGQFAQDMAGPPAPPPTHAGAAAVDPQRSQAPSATTASGPPKPIPVETTAITPGRPLTGITVDPAPSDAFGKMPKGTKTP